MSATSGLNKTFPLPRWSLRDRAGFGPPCSFGHARIWPNRIWPELVFQSVDRIWPNRIWPILDDLMFWPNFLLLLLLLSLFLLLFLFLVVVVVLGCCLLLLVGACCWCLLVVPVGGACWWCLLVVPVCVCGGCVQDFWASPGPPSAGPPFRTAQNFALFFPSPRRKILFFPLWCLLVEFWWCF